MYNRDRFDDVLRQWSEVFMGRSMRDFSAFMRNSGLSMPQVSLLSRLYYQGQCGVTDIADHLAVTSPAASQMVERLVQGYGVRDLTIYDDNFVVHRARLEAFCDGLRARGYDLSWSCNARVDVITEELARRVKAAGCWQMSLGIESGVPEILARECKGIELDQVRRADYFTILGVGRVCTPHEVREAAERLLAEFEPHRFAAYREDGLPARLEEIRRVVADAREVLVDEQLRAEYVRGLGG